MFSSGPPSSAASCQSTLTLPEGHPSSTLSPRACPPLPQHPTPTREAPFETWPTPASRLAGQSAEVRVNRLGHTPGQPEAPSLDSRTSGAGATRKKRQDLSALIALGTRRAGGCRRLPPTTGETAAWWGAGAEARGGEAPGPAGAAQAPSQHVRSSHSGDLVP